MIYLVIISLSLYIFLYSCQLYSKVLNLYSDKSYDTYNLYNQNLNSHVSEYYFEGGYTINKISILPKEETEQYFNYNPVCLTLAGFINIQSDIIFNDIYYNTLSIGDSSNINITHSYIEGNKTSITGLKQIIIDSFDSIIMKNVTINDISSFIFNQNAYEQKLENVNFVNSHDLDFNIYGRKIILNNVAFYMLQDSNLRLNFSIFKDMNIFGNDINIEGDSQSKAYIYFIGKKGLISQLSGINSKVNSLLSFNNVNLTVSREIKLSNTDNEISILDSQVKGRFNLLNDNNIFNITNSSVKGSIVFSNNKNYLNINNSILNDCIIHFFGSSNEIVLHDTVSSVGGKLLVNKDSNTVSIMGNFSGSIHLLGSHNTLNFKDSIIHDVEIFSKSYTNLHFFNTIMSGKIDITSEYKNNIYFINVLSKDSLTFNNSNIHLIYKENSNNFLGGKITIDVNSTVDITLQDNAVLEVSYISNLPINSIIFNNNSRLVINNNSFKTNSFVQNGDSEILINLNDKLDYYIYSTNTDFNNYKVILKTVNSNLTLPENSDQTAIVLLKSDTKINNLSEVVFQSGLLNYEVIYKDKEIVLDIKKEKNFVDLIDYKSSISIFDNSNLTNLAHYLDMLWKKDKLAILDEASKIANSKDYLVFLNTVFPVSNHILYKSSYESIITFVNVINNIESNYKVKNKVWSNFYNLVSHFTVGHNNLKNLTLNGKGMSIGATHKLNSFWLLGLVVGFGINELEDYNYNINTLNYVTSIYSKFNHKEMLHNTTSLVFIYNKFQVNRKVFYGSYSHTNTSSPRNISYTLNNESIYKLPVLNYGIYNYTVFPRINLMLSNLNVPDYKELGEEALSLKGSGIFIYNLEGGITSLLNINLKRYSINTKLGINVGYNYNSLSSTKFRFKNSNLLNTVDLSDFYKNNVYFKTHVDISCNNAKNILGISLSIDYTKSKLFDSTNVNVSGFMKV